MREQMKPVKTERETRDKIQPLCKREMKGIVKSMKKRIFAAILAAAMTFSAVSVLLPAADISVSAAKSEKLPAPTRIDVIERTDDSATLLWESVEGADGYVIYRYNAKTKKYEKLKNLKEKDYPVEYYSHKYPSYKIEGMKKGETYQFKIAARVKGKDGKYTVQTKSKAVTVKVVDAPEISIPPIGMTESEFFKKYDKNAFALSFFPMAFMDPYGGYKGEVLYQGKPAEASVHFDDEGRIQLFELLRKDIKKSAIDQECDRLTQKYGEPFFSEDKSADSSATSQAAWFSQNDRDQGMLIVYTYFRAGKQSADAISVVYMHEGADEFGKFLIENPDIFSTASYGVKGKEET